MEEKKLLAENELDANGGVAVAPGWGQEEEAWENMAFGSASAEADAIASEGKRFDDIRRGMVLGEGGLDYVSAGAVNPEDIENFTVLKDASAAQIYGMGGLAPNSNIICQTRKYDTIIVAEGKDQFGPHINPVIGLYIDGKIF